MSIRLRLMVVCIFSVVIPLILMMLGGFVLFFLNMPANIVEQIAGQYFCAMGILGVILVALSSLALSYAINAYVLKPLLKLEKGANEIRQGQLESSLFVSGNDEIARLGTAFEQMRIQLKASLSAQQGYEKDRTALIASISHDLKTPITSIKGYVEGLIDNVADTDEKKERYLKMIYQKASEIDKMVNDLFLSSRLGLGSIPLNLKKTDIQNYIKAFAENYDFEDMKLSLNLFEEKLESLIDHERFLRVLSNIVNNSIKYKNADKGEISITLERSANEALIEIKDNGQGIKPDDVTKVFEQFYRSDSSRSLTKGTGLGLAISKQIVELHHGKIWIRSNLGKGTSVFILLPLFNGGFYEKDTCN